MKFDKESLLLYAITDRSWLNGQTLYEQAEEALKGGVTCLQLREKELEAEAFEQEAQSIKSLCKSYQVPFIINDNVELAVAVEADGVHVGQGDLPVEEVRKRIGEHKILGVSAQTVDQAVEAEKKGADYLGVGAVFTTSTKKDADTISMDVLRAICQAVTIPVVAIGGIGKENLMELQGTGIAGVSIISAIFSSKDIEGTSRELLRLSTEMVNG